MTSILRAIGLLSLSLMLAAGAVALPGSAPAEARQLIDRGSTQNSSWESYMTRNTENQKVANYRSSASNSTRQRATLSCTASESTSLTWSVGGSVSGEIKAGIFGGVKTEVNASVARNRTASTGVTISFPVPPRSTRYCDWGIVKERLTGYTRLSYCGGGCNTVRRNWSFQAPARTRWWIY